MKQLKTYICMVKLHCIAYINDKVGIFLIVLFFCHMGIGKNVMTVNVINF